MRVTYANCVMKPTELNTVAPKPSIAVSTLYAITRIDSARSGSYGWQVRLMRQGQRYGKFFSDSSYSNDSQRALLTAKKWRDALLKELSNQRHASIHQRNHSGVVGVVRITVKTAKKSYYFWQATWHPQPGQRVCVKFSILRYGEQGAFDRAVQARQQGINRSFPL